MKQCFLECVLYPEDREIKREELIKLWVMEGLLDDAGSRTEQKNKGHTILNKLENSCLLESVINHSGECVKMHDLIREMALMITKKHPRFIAKSGLQLTEVPEEKHWTEDLVKASLGWNKIEEIPCNMSPKCPRLSVLLFQHNPLKSIPQSLLVYMRGLKVLNLSHTDIQRLPDGISDLENLRMLLLEFCLKLTYVPSVAKLANLRVLHLPVAGMFREAPAGLEELKCLEEITCQWSGSQLAYFNRISKISIPHHCQLGFSEGSGWPGFNLFSLEYKGKELVIERAEFGERESTLLVPCDIQRLVLYLCKTNGRDIGDILPSLGEVKELKRLKIWHCDIKVLMSSTPQSPLTATAIFFHLRELYLVECPEIKVLFSFNLIEEQHSHDLLPNLKALTIQNCVKLEEIFESPSSAKDLSILALPKLRELSLCDLPELQSIYGGLLICTSLKNCQTILQNLTIENCPKLKCLPLSDCLLCDLSTLMSIPIDTDNPEWWSNLRLEHPQAAAILEDYWFTAIGQQESDKTLALPNLKRKRGSILPSTFHSPSCNA